MASAMKRIVFSTQCNACRRLLNNQPGIPPSTRRTFSTSCPRASSRRAGGTVIRRKEKGLEEEGDVVDTSPPIKMLPFRKALNPAQRTMYASLSPEERKTFREEYKAIGEHLTSPRVMAGLSYDFDQAVFDTSRQLGKRKVREERMVSGIMAMGQDDERGNGPDEDPFDDSDDMPSLAHEELNEHKDIRHYARIAAWEMPLLYKLAKPFEMPSQDKVLRFRYTSYMGDQHSAETKVVVQFCVNDLPDLTQQQRDKMIKLAGPRYNPETTLVKMSCDSFETQAQNKRYLGDLVDKLLAEAKDPNDPFTDVPFDFRHHTYSHKPEFPESWRLTKARKEQLEAARQQRALAESEVLEKESMISGVGSIEAAYAALPGIGFGGESRKLEGAERDRVRFRR